MVRNKSLVISIVWMLLVFMYLETSAATPSCPKPQTFVNSTGMKFVRIEPGLFLMGRDQGFEAGDFIAVLQTAYDDALGGAHNAPDANFLTFHSIHDFRSVKNHTHTSQEW